MKTTWPFSEILRPLAEEALAGIRAPGLIRHAFARHLERRFSETLSPCLFLHFSARRITWEICRGSRRGCFRSFARDALQRGVIELLSGYPRAVEAIEILTRQTREFAEEFWSHLRADRVLLRTSFGVPHERTGKGISVGWSDPHRGGKSVVRVNFGHGTTVFYKPRSLAVERLWGAGLVRFGSRLELGFRSAVNVDLDEYGWAAAVPQSREMKRAQACRFYWRFGALTCLAWLLDAVDLHRQNVVIAAEDPVFIDVEGLLHPLDPGENRTLERTGLLPAPGGGIDVSALGTTVRQLGEPTWIWTHSGSDELGRQPQRMIIPAASHLPRVDGVVFPPQSALPDLRAGFSAAVRAARQDREAINEWRHQLASCPRRRFHRPTLEYAALLAAATRPDRMGTAAGWGELMVNLQRSAFNEQVAEAERRQLEGWDVPTFAVDEPSQIEAPWNELDGCSREFYRQAS